MTNTTSDSDRAQATATDDEFLIPATTHRVEETVSRSRFLTTLAHAETADDARSFVADVRVEFPDATHHCWAFVAGPPGSSASVGMSDDGEPHGTAGRPMLHTLTHSSVGQIVAVCTRFYGGTKLGTGGLARAYAGGVALALKELPTKLKVEQRTLRVELPYSAVDTFARLQQKFKVTILRRDYDANAIYRCQVPARTLDAFKQALDDASRGLAVVSPNE